MYDLPKALPKFTTVVVAPEYADELLRTQPVGRNRRLNQLRIRRYARDMINKRWILNGDVICIDWNGHLFDGQHRLHAVIHAGVPTTMTIASNLNPLALRTKDDGMGRTIGHIAQIENIVEKNHAYTGAVGAWMWRYANRTDDGRLGYAATASKLDLLDVLLDNADDIVRSMQYIGFAKEERRLICGAAGVFVHLMAARSDRDKADEFFEQVKVGANISETCPAYLLRRQLLRRLTITGGSGGRDKWCALIAKAWLWHRDGDDKRVLKWLDTEPFPEFGDQ